MVDGFTDPIDWFNKVHLLGFYVLFNCLTSCAKWNPPLKVKITWNVVLYLSVMGLLLWGILLGSCAADWRTSCGERFWYLDAMVFNFFTCHWDRERLTHCHWQQLTLILHNILYSIFAPHFLSESLPLEAVLAIWPRCSVALLLYSSCVAIVSSNFCSASASFLDPNDLVQCRLVPSGVLASFGALVLSGTELTSFGFDFICCSVDSKTVL